MIAQISAEAEHTSLYFSGFNMIFFVRSYSIDTDSRLQKYLQLCSISNIKYRVLGWNKDIKEEDTDVIKYYNGDFKLGKQWLNLLAIFKWWFFVFRKLIKNRNQITHVHSVDLDCGIVCFVFCTLFRKKHIYDVYDVYTENRNIKGRMKAVINTIEKKICLSSYAYIMPEKFRLAQLSIDENKSKRFLEIENVPFIKNVDCQLQEDRGASNHIKLVYAGSLEPVHRGIENLLRAVSEDKRFFLDIAGIGPLSQLCKEYSQEYSNIFFHGQLQPTEVYQLEASSDVIIGLYYKSRDNHLFASPNKYYEHLAFGKPMLTTEKTPPGDKVLSANTGYAIGDEPEDIETWMESVAYNPDFADKGRNAKKLWDEKYDFYFDSYFRNAYLKILGEHNV